MSKIRQKPVVIRHIYTKVDGEFVKEKTIHIYQQERYEELRDKYYEIQKVILEERRLEVENQGLKLEK